MANYNNPNIGVQQMSNLMGQQQAPIQFPYGNNNMLLSNTPYDNYMERTGGYIYYPTGGNGQGSMGRSGMSYYTEMPGMMSRDPP